MRDFWRSCGFHLLRRDDEGKLGVTDDYLRAYFGRPELAPVAESCDAERALHARLLENPRLEVAESDIQKIQDDDARENYAVMLGFRDMLLEAGTVEGCYLGLFQSGDVTLPGLFFDQMAHVIVRNILDEATDPFQARAGELLFREQNATIEQGAILLGDTETVEMLATTGGMGSLGKLVVEGGATNKGYLLQLLDSEEFRAGGVDTGWLDESPGLRSGTRAYAVEALVTAAILAYQRARDVALPGA